MRPVGEHALTAFSFQWRLGCLRRFLIELLALLSQPTMLLNPFLGFGSCEKVAEVTRSAAWP
jgi:hypothetical protein